MIDAEAVEFEDEATVPWAPGTPSDWPIMRGKAVFLPVKRPVRDCDEVVTAFRDGQVTLRSNRREEGFTFATQEHGYHGVRAGDLVVHAMDAFAGAIGVSESDGKMSPVCSLVRVRGSSGEGERYYAYLLREMAVSGFLSAIARGIRERSTDFRLRELLANRYPVPPRARQRSIANFLDRETAHIDALIEKKERLIRLLDEKRAALITHAVTKGLNPDAPMKDSGVEWIGEIPEHWEVAAVARLVSPSRRVTYGIVQPGQPDPNGIPMIRGKDYSRGWAPLEEIFRVSPEVERPYRRARVEPGDVLMTIVGAGTGNVAVVPRWLEGANLTQTTARIAPHRKVIDAGYLALSLSSGTVRGQVDLLSKGAAQPGLNLEHLKRILVAVPPIEEQATINIGLEIRVKRLEAIRDKSIRSITLLRERRAALITAAVTGQIEIPEGSA